MSRILIMTALLAAATAAWGADTSDIEPGVATSSAAAPAQAPAPAVKAPATPAAAAPAATATTAVPASDAGAAAAATGDSTRGLDEQIQGLKTDVIDLNTELFSLEEELLYPANTQVAVFVSMDVGEFFALDSVTVKIDDKQVSNYLYTPREVNALLQGGVQRMYVGNLKAGQHELVAFFTGKGPNDRDYKRGATIKFEKSIGAKYLELKITDRASKLQPEFAIRDWE